MHHSIWTWIGFNLFVLAMLALDLGVFHRKAHAVRPREAAIWSVVWVVLALAFGGGVAHFMGRPAGLEFLTGYLIEKALSVDNLFVFVLIFSYFGIAPKNQHRVLFWGIIGALVMRGVMIAAGAALIQQFHWVIYLFGAFLVFTGIRMAFHDDTAIHPEKNPVLRLVSRFLPVVHEDHGEKFFVRQQLGPGGPVRRAATLLFVVLILIETSDLLFAVDSIPAVFAVTRDPFLVYTSNIFAILGLRSLYFLLADLIGKLHYLKYGLSLVLAFVGVKMLLADLYPLPIALSLGLIAGILATSAGVSLLFPRAASEPDSGAAEPDGAVVEPGYASAEPDGTME
jgi:tellurite resistance protein TerC